MPSFDFNRIADEMEMTREDILHLMSLYGPELRRDFEALNTALGQMEWRQLKEVLHKMKGDAANLCLCPLAAQFKEMEQAAQARAHAQTHEGFQAAQARDASALAAGLTEALQLSGTLWEAFRDYEQNCK